jgi:nucleoside-diphosphate-sugar epimerase
MSISETKILVIGALGQIGSELVDALYTQYGVNNVIASDIRPSEQVQLAGTYIQLDVTNKQKLYEIVETYQIETIYNLAAILSAKGEQNPLFAWQLNMDGLLHTLEAAREIACLKKIFWPSSIAVFGPHSPTTNTPQDCVMDPNTVYGISKLAGERWCEYYAQKYGVDVRSVRYPGLIGYKAAPGGGTTDYAVDIYHYAVQNKDYTCFLTETLPCR